MKIEIWKIILGTLIVTAVPACSGTKVVTEGQYSLTFSVKVLSPKGIETEVSDNHTYVSPNCKLILHSNQPIVSINLNAALAPNGGVSNLLSESFKEKTKKYIIELQPLLCDKDLEAQMLMIQIETEKEHSVVNLDIQGKCKE